MPVYQVSIKGDARPRLVRATSAAQALRHVADAEPVSADKMAEILGQGVTLETASATNLANELGGTGDGQATVEEEAKVKEVETVQEKEVAEEKGAKAK